MRCSIVSMSSWVPFVPSGCVLRSVLEGCPSKNPPNCPAKSDETGYLTTRKQSTCRSIVRFVIRRSVFANDSGAGRSGRLRRGIFQQRCGRASVWGRQLDRSSAGRARFHSRGVRSLEFDLLFVVFDAIEVRPRDSRVRLRFRPQELKGGLAGYGPAPLAV